LAHRGYLILACPEGVDDTIDCATPFLACTAGASPSFLIPFTAAFHLYSGDIGIQRSKMLLRIFIRSIVTAIIDMTIRLIFTTCIEARYADPVERETAYYTTITNNLNTMRGLPIEYYIVENGGKRRTVLDDISGVHVLYTDTNAIKYTGSNPDAETGLKPMKEMMDIQKICNTFDFDDEDIIIKITGRYGLQNPPTFLENLIENEGKYDVFMKFFNICTMNYDEMDCVLGLYAIRYKYLQEFNPRYMLEQESAEHVFATFVRRTVPPEKILEVSHLGLVLPRETDPLV
jgi:hypothetical protein